ncbi:MAG: ExbD/TolR family protein [Planctomycetota bacterium]
MARIRTRIEEEPRGGLTTMIDIVFLLLIFFLILPFKDQDRRFPSPLPKDGPGPAEARAQEPLPTVRVSIRGTPGGGVRYEVERRTVPAGELGVAVLAAGGGDKQTPVVLAPDAGVRFAHVMRALDQCAIVQMRNVTFPALP